jgi:hypothetical protein
MPACETLVETTLMKKKSTFHRNFDSAIVNAMNSENVDFTTLRFELLPQFDDDDMMNATDAWMIHVVLNFALRNSNEVGYREAIRLMSAGRQHYPLWTKVKKIDHQKLSIEFCSKYRTIKTCLNQETGIPPFQVSKK